MDKMTEKIAELLCTEEGFKTTSYQDGAGVWTVGFGFTGKLHDGRDVKDVRNLSLDDAKKELEYRIQDTLKSINNLCGTLTGNQTIALTSLAYNVGVNAISKSMLLKKIKASDFLGASDEFQRWAICNGKPVRGLKLRRHREAILFLS